MTILQHNKTNSIHRILKLSVFILIISSLITSNTYAERAQPVVQMILHPSKTTENTQKYLLLPKDEELIDADAAPLYTKAIASLPKELDTNQINKWRKTPPDQLPQKQVQTTLEQFKPAYQSLEQAAKCKRCDWTENVFENLTPFRSMAFLMTLQIHSQIAQNKYDSAIDTMRTGYTMAKNLNKEPMIIPGLVAIANIEIIATQIEYFIQNQDAPNLYQALSDLPQPLIDLSIPLEIEETDTVKKVQLLTNRLDRHIVALQCIEALRLYAGSHDGKFPDKLSDVTEVKIPNDPVTKKPFSYTRTGSEAILELKGTESPDGRDAIRYELKLEE